MMVIFLPTQGRTRTPSGEACGKGTRCTFTARAWWKRACARLSHSTAPSLTCPWTRRASTPEIQPADLRDDDVYYAAVTFTNALNLKYMSEHIRV